MYRRGSFGEGGSESTDCDYRSGSGEFLSSLFELPCPEK